MGARLSTAGRRGALRGPEAWLERERKDGDEKGENESEDDKRKHEGEDER